MSVPVHKVMEDYDLLNVSVIQNTHSINLSAAMLWRMNLCAVSNEIPCTFFVALNYRVNVYTLDTILSPFKNPTKTLVSPNARNTGGGSESPYIINAVKTSRMLQKEILVTASENGEVCIWKTESLDEPPMIINNEVATWGISIHADQGLLAVSANNWRITVYNILEMTRSNPIFGTKTNKKHSNNIMGSETKIELAGHEHNIPNIDFSESGRYVASASIDQTCRVWDITTREEVTQKTFPARHNLDQSSWCWSVKFIKPGHFKYAVCTDKNISKAYLQRLYQGRSTSLLNLGLSHSASTPMFPMTTSNIYDLEDEDMDFLTYENDETDDMWDRSLLEEEDNFMEEIFEQQRREDDHIYNHGEIPSERHALLEDENVVEDEDESETDDEGGLDLFRTAITYRVDSDIDDEIESEYYFNLDRRENSWDSQTRHGLQEPSEELIEQRQEEEDNGEEDREELLEDETENEDEEIGAMEDGIEVWTAPAELPTQTNWTQTIVYENRDGWGDEIATVMRNSSIAEEDQPIPGNNNSLSHRNNNPSTEVIRAISQDGLDAHGMDLEHVPSFINNGSSWNDNDATISDPDTQSSTNDSSLPPYCIPNVIKSTSSSQLETQCTNSKDNQDKLNQTLGEYLMISTGKDVMLMSTTTPKMSRIRAEHNMINKVDVRSDQMLSVLDRINMVEWLPELELYVSASQKGTVALMRILQVEFEGGEQACIFNNECYLPTNVLQATPLYGMTVKKVEAERFTPISYQIFLFYYSGNVLSYTISRKDSDLLVENLIL